MRNAADSAFRLLVPRLMTPGVSSVKLPKSSPGLRLEVLAIALGLTAGAASLLAFGSWRRRSITAKILAGLNAARIAFGTRTYRAAELAGLPEPVQRYFRAVLKEAQPFVRAVRIEHTGQINMSASGESWKRFTSVQQVVSRRPGFDWDARIHLLPGLTVGVHDAYVAGEGILDATLFGLVSLAHMRGGQELAQGELLRFFAEMAWYPTALLPRQGVEWAAVDRSSAIATLTDGHNKAALLFRFADNGLIDSVLATARGRAVGGVSVPTPWEGRWSNYRLRGGMLIPLDGEVAWVLAGAPKPYWRGSVTSICFDVSA